MFSSNIFAYIRNFSYLCSAKVWPFPVALVLLLAATTAYILKPGDNRPYKIIENDHVVIIRNNEKYDVTGKKLQ